MADSSWVERAYTHFLGRDLAYLTGGAIVVTAVQLLRGVPYEPGQGWFWIAFYLTRAYFVGLLVSETIDGCFGFTRGLLEYRNDRLAIYLREVSPAALARFERTMFLLHVGKALSTCCFVAALLLLLSGRGPQSFSVALIGVAAHVLWVKKGRDARRERAEILRRHP